WCYDRHCSVRLVICFDLAIDQIAQSGLSSLKVIYYSAQLFSGLVRRKYLHDTRMTGKQRCPGKLVSGYKENQVR
ncbi:hypothetical protein, partial [Shigella flexneri]|uniref:hypothetical protein n=2 Tax=Shigella flexneri TaxID=623 RepID=UPI001C0A7F31